MENYYNCGSDGGDFYSSDFVDGLPFPTATKKISSFPEEEKILGFNYGYMANRGELRSKKARDSQEKLFNLGVNWVCLAVANYQQTYNSTLIYADHFRTPTDTDIAAFVEDAHKRGVKVCLKPMVNSEDGVWRANISFPDLGNGDMDSYWLSWFISYKNFLLHYAELAQELGCEMFCIGCEMIGTEHRKYDWLYLIQEIRRVYSGKIIYNANHDREDAEDWFSELDYIGTSAYYSIGKEGLSKEKAIEEWNRVKERLNTIAAKRNKKYIFMEIGCRSAKNNSIEPWDYSSKYSEPSEEEQAIFYESCLETFLNEPNFAGVFWWDWSTILYDLDYAKFDTGYNIYGKKAEKIVKKYYKGLK